MITKYIGGDKRRKVYGLGFETSFFYPRISSSSRRLYLWYEAQNTALQQVADWGWETKYTWFEEADIWRMREK